MILMGTGLALCPSYPAIHSYFIGKKRHNDVGVQPEPTTHPYLPAHNPARSRRPSTPTLQPDG